MDKRLLAIDYYLAKKYKESYNLFKSIGDGESTYYLGMQYLYGQGVKQSDDKAFLMFKKSWEALYPDGIYMYGYCYEQGIGTEANFEQAFKLYQAARDSVYAKIRLAKIYEQGIHVTKDLMKAIKLYNECQKLGNGYAMYKIGRFYLTGEGLKQDLTSGYQWLQKALAKNEILAINYFRMIGSKVSTDVRTTEDIFQQAKSAIEQELKEEALSYLEVCIKEQSIDAIMLLMKMYWHGELFDKDEEKAFKLLLKNEAIESSIIDYHIGYFYEHGIGTRSSYYKASLFYEKAGLKGHDLAIQALKEMRGLV